MNPQAARYYYTTTGADLHGPVSLLELRSLLQAGQIPTNGQFCEEGDGQWEPLDRLPAVLPATPLSERVPCPACKEPILRGATICPFCRQSILSGDPATNAFAKLVLGAVVFVVLYYALTAFTHHEADREYSRIQQQAERETDRLMEEAKRKYPNY